jgi:hypothetical protein
MVAAFVERVEFHARSTRIHAALENARRLRDDASFFRGRGMGAAILGKGEWFERLPAIADSGNH